MSAITRSIEIMLILSKKNKPVSFTQIRRELMTKYEEEVDQRTVKATIQTLAMLFKSVKYDESGFVSIQRRFKGKDNLQAILKSELNSNPCFTQTA